MKEITKKYTNNDITIVWKPSVCILSTKCWKGEQGLLQVFNPSQKPWIKPDGADTKHIIERINNCTFGALSFYYNTSKNQDAIDKGLNTIEVIKHGPLIHNRTMMANEMNGAKSVKEKITAVCRCGASLKKNFL